MPRRLLYSDAVHQTTLAIKESKYEQLHLRFIAYRSQNLYLILKEKFKIWLWHIDFSKVDMCLPIKWESFPESKDRAIKCHLLAINLMRFANSRSMKEEGHLADLHSLEEEGGMCLRCGWTQKLRLYHHNSFLLETQLCSTCCFLLFYCRWGSPLVCMSSDSFSHSSCWLGETLEEKESLSMYMNSRGGYHLLLLGFQAPIPCLKHYGW